MGQTDANYRIGTYAGQPHFQCLLCPQDRLDEGAMKEHIFRGHGQEARGKLDDRPKEEEATASSASTTTQAAQKDPSASQQGSEETQEEAKPARQPAGQDKAQTTGGKE